MIDWNRVNTLRDEVGAEDFAEVVEMFLEEVDEVIDRLRSVQDSNALEHDMHFLKGSSLNLGFASFSSLCQSAESAAKLGKHDSINIESILQNYDASREAFLEKV